MIEATWQCFSAFAKRSREKSLDRVEEIEEEDKRKKINIYEEKRDRER